MRTYICDRCGKPKAPMTVWIDKTLLEMLLGEGMDMTIRFDLCKPCAKDFVKWMKGAQP